MRRTLLVCMLTAGCANTSGDYRARAADPELLHAAMGDLTSVIVYDILNPPQAARIYAYSSIAAYEAARPGYPAQRSLAGQLNGLTPPPEPRAGVEYSYPVAAIHAFLTVGRAMTFSRD